MNKIEIGGKQYPCRITMGALRRYKQIEGEDISQMGNDTAKVGTLLFCAVQSACKADGVPFDDDIDTFADRVDLTTIGDFANAITGAGEGKKKTAKP